VQEQRSQYAIRRAIRLLLGLGPLVLCLGCPIGEWMPAADAEYVARFMEQHTWTPRTEDLAAYATVEAFDKTFEYGEFWDNLDGMTNDDGAIAWGVSYRMMAFNEMYRVTGDRKYLEANRRLIRLVFDARDEVRGVALWTGRTVPAWSAEGYAERGRAVLAVHTGMITWPIFEFLLLAKGDSVFRDELGGQFNTIRDTALESLAVHDRQWCDGPGQGEGYYIGLDQEDVCENRPLPANRLSAIGRAQWLAWQVTRDTTHRDRARAIGRYIKARMITGLDAAYYWTYWLPELPSKEPVFRTAIDGEDTAHATLTLALPLALADAGQIFGEADLLRFSRTVLKGFGRRADGVLFGNITGDPASDPASIGYVAWWLALADREPEVAERIVPFYLEYKPTWNMYERALLASYAIRHS